MPKNDSEKGSASAEGHHDSTQEQSDATAENTRNQVIILCNFPRSLQKIINYLQFIGGVLSSLGTRPQPDTSAQSNFSLLNYQIPSTELSCEYT